MTLTELFASMAASIRTKTGKDGGIIPTDFPAEIDSILSPTDGSLPSKSESDLTVSGPSIIVPSGYYGSDVTKSVATVDQATPIISVSESGLITASSVQETGYVIGETLSSTQQLTTKAAATITPGTLNKTAVAKGVYTTGTVSVAGSSNLVAGNIKSGVNIFGVTGSYTGISGGFITSIYQNAVTTSRTFIAPDATTLTNAWNNGNCTIVFAASNAPPVSGSYTDIHSGYCTFSGSSVGYGNGMGFILNYGIGGLNFSFTATINGQYLTLTCGSGYCFPAAQYYLAMHKN